MLQTFIQQANTKNFKNQICCKTECAIYFLMAVSNFKWKCFSTVKHKI